ncbi:MAG: hypothetical protein GXP29_02325 [Planctomycetes bacterium]|nr:hypothetical protein [Planctomycetota bacterium]
MKSKLSTLFAVVVLSYGLTSPVVMGEKKSGDKSTAKSHVTTESCVLKISWDASASRLNMNVVEALLRSSGVWGKALNETFGEDTAQIRDSISVRLTLLSGWSKGTFKTSSTIVTRLLIKFEGDPLGKSGRLLARVCDNLNKALTAFGESTVVSTHEKRQRYEGELQRARVEVHKILAERQAFLEATQTSELSRKRLLSEFRDLQETKLHLEMTRSVSRARRDAMQEQIARILAESRANPLSQKTIEHFEKVVALRQAALSEAKKLYEANRIRSSDFSELAVSLSEAELELARVRDESIRNSSNSIGGDLVVDMNRQLTEMAIDDADQEAKHTATLERLERVKASLKVAEEYEQLGGNRLNFARDRLKKIEGDLATIERRISTLIRPTMTVIGAN